METAYFTNKSIIEIPCYFCNSILQFSPAKIRIYKRTCKCSAINQIKIVDLSYGGEVVYEYMNELRQKNGVVSSNRAKKSEARKKEIDKMLSLLTQLWHSDPDKTMGKMFYSIAHQTSTAVPYFMEDDEALTAMEKMIGEDK